MTTNSNPATTSNPGPAEDVTAAVLYADYQFTDGDTINLTLAATPTASSGGGPGYAVTAVSGTYQGKAITGEVITVNAIGASDNTVFTGANGLFGNDHGIDALGVGFSTSAGTFTLIGDGFGDFGFYNGTSSPSGTLSNVTTNLSVPPAVTQTVNATVSGLTPVTIGTATAGFNGDALSVKLTNDAAFASSTLSLVNGSLIYSPGDTSVSNGSDAISYIVTDSVTGASVTEQQTLTLADPALYDYTGTGTLLIDGTATETNTPGQPVTIGNADTGTVEVSNGDSATATSADGTQPATIIGASSGRGDLIVTGVGSTYTADGELVVGGTGPGSANVLAGGTLTAAVANTAASPAAVIGGGAGSDGSDVLVSGSNAVFTVNGALDIGAASEGGLTAASGGTVNATSLDLGLTAGSPGTAVVTGANSQITLTGNLTVGDAGSGELSILNGGQVSAYDVTVGDQASGTGNVDIEGASTLSVADNLTIGNNGAAVLTLGAAATLHVVNALNVAASAVFNDFGTLDPATQTVSGTLNLNSASPAVIGTLTLASTGVINVTNVGTLKSDHIVTTGSTGGTIRINSNTTFTLLPDNNAAGPVFTNSGGFSAGPTISFADNTGTLIDNDPAGLLGITVTGFVAGDKIELGTGGSKSFNSTTDILTIYGLPNGTDPVATIQFAAGTSAAAVNAGVAACYCPGTLIATPTGERAIETLAIGDLVLTVSGVAKPIRWIGRRTYTARFAKANRAIWPVHIAPGALDDGVPSCTLSVSPRHAMFLAGVLVPAGDLVTGHAITQPVPAGAVEYIHVELDEHDIVYANGAPSESYVDDDNRGLFHNAAEFAALYPGVTPAPAAYCAPRCQDGYRIEAIRTAIARRAPGPLQSAA